MPYEPADDHDRHVAGQSVDPCRRWNDQIDSDSVPECDPPEQGDQARRFSCFQVELPSRRWLYEALDHRDTTS